MSVDVVRRRFAVGEYLQMAEAGILTERDRVELLDGEIVEMTPIGRPRRRQVSYRDADAEPCDLAFPDLRIAVDEVFGS